MEMCPWRTGSELDQTSSDGSVTSSHQTTAWFAQLILGYRNTIAGLACVGVHSEAMITDPADFSTEIAHAHFAGTALREALTALQCFEHSVGLGFGID